MVGIGPGCFRDRTLRAQQAIEESQAVVGYRRYLDLIEDLTKGKELVASGMRKETERCEAALRLAQGGLTVSLVSSGDAGIYGMAGLVLELAARERTRIPIEVVAGVTSASAVAARLGAPLMLDFACINLSDLLVPWETIKRRLEAVAAADLVTALYNPKSSKRRSQLEEAAAIFRRYRHGATPVGIGTSLGTEDETVVLTDLEHMLENDINMRTTVIIGNNSSRILEGWFVTPRGYKV